MNLESLPTEEVAEPIENHSPIVKHRLNFFDDTVKLSPLNSIQQIYKSSKELITEIDNRISLSHQKSEINKSQKYQYIIKSLQNQVIRLKKRIKLEQLITNPTKDYINDILNQLVNLKRQNQLLKKQLSESKHSVILLKSVVQSQKKRVNSPAKDLSRSKVQKLPTINISMPDTKDIIQKYFLQKISALKLQTKLDKFLKDLRKSPIELNKLLIQIDRWIEGQNTKLGSDTIRLRYHLNHKSPLKKSDIKTNSVDFRKQSIQFQHFLMPTEQLKYSARKLIRKRDHL